MNEGDAGIGDASDAGEAEGTVGGDDASAAINPYAGCIELALWSQLQDSECGDGATFTQVPGYCVACTCVFECSRDSDCPLAPAGTASAACYDGRFCAIPCGDEAPCPDGMACESFDPTGLVDARFCVERLDEPLACAEDSVTPAWPDPCPAFLDQASCEAQVSKYDSSCKWATETLYQVPADDCTPIETTQRCVMVEPSGWSAVDGCDAPGRCDATGTRVFFEDLGAGTVRLISYEDCELTRPRLYPEGNPVDLCDFEGNTPLPVICGCGCPGPGAGDSTSG